MDNQVIKLTILVTESKFYKHFWFNFDFYKVKKKNSNSQILILVKTKTEPCPVLPKSYKKSEQGLVLTCWGLGLEPTLAFWTQVFGPLNFTTTMSS